VSWIGPRSVDGGLDLVPLRDEPGAIWLCGKHLAGPDPDAALARADGADTVVCFCEESELADRYPNYPAWLREHAGQRALWHPIPDLTAPAVSRAHEIATDLAVRVRRGDHLVLHCAAGKGRAPTMTIATMLVLGIPLAAALTAVAEARPGAGPEVGAQNELVEAIAEIVGGDL